MSEMTPDIAKTPWSTVTHILHVLRNPWSISEEVVRQARYDACDLIEALADANRRMNSALAQVEVRVDYLRSVAPPLCPTCGCVQAHQPTDARGAITGCFDNFHTTAVTVAQGERAAGVLTAFHDKGEKR